MFNEIVCHELPPIGRYRVRLLKKDLEAPVALDVRECVGVDAASQKLAKFGFQGFTRRGIRLSTTKEIAELRDHLNVVLSMLEVKGEKLSKQ